MLVSAIFWRTRGRGSKKKKSHGVKPHLFKGRAPKNQNVIRSKTVFVRKLPAPCKFQRRTVDICSPRPGGAIRGVKETRVVSMVTSWAPRNKVHPSATTWSLRRRRWKPWGPWLSRGRSWTHEFQLPCRSAQRPPPKGIPSRPKTPASAHAAKGSHVCKLSGLKHLA